MSAKETFWDVRSEDDHKEMAALLAPMIVASRDRNFIQPGAAKAQTYAWRLTLADVPKPIVAEAIEVFVSRGLTWLPKPGEVKAECAAIVERKRKLVREHFLSSCAHDSQYIDGPNGSVSRCPCWHGMQKALSQVAKPITLPAREEVDA